MKGRKFLRKDTCKLLRLGRRKKKLRKWRRAKGRHSKVREKRRGYLKAPLIGYRKQAETRGLIAGLKPKIIHNVAELNQVGPKEIIIIGKIGKKKKIEIAKLAVESKKKILNLNAELFLKKIENEKKKAELVKKELKEKKVEKMEEKKKEEKITEEKSKKEEEKEYKKKMLKETPIQKQEIKKRMDFEE
jgi:ribosomal protein L32E